jgi:hypothetical protein
MGRGTWSIRWLAVVLAATVATGCKPDEASSPSPAALRTPDEGASARWPFWPETMRLHPLTRLVLDVDSGDAVIESRIEFLDREEDTTKGWGRLRIDLHDESDGPNETARAEWNLDLRDPGVNRQYFDDVTRTYLFRLELAPGQLPEQPVLRAYFLAANGAELKSSLRVRTE